MSQSTDSTTALAAAPLGKLPARRRQHHIPELLTIHADELAYLWGQRRAALQDTRYTLTSFLELNDRVEAHVSGLLAVPTALPEMLGQRLMAAQDRDEAFAAAHPLLRLSNPAITAKVTEVFATASGPMLWGLRDAMAFAPLGPADGALHAMMTQGEAARAVAAAMVLAQHEQLHPQDGQLSRLLLDDDPAVAAQAWRVVTRIDARLAAATPEGAPPRPYKPALLREESPLKTAVLGAALWTAQPWAMRGLRLLVEQGHVAALDWLAAVGAAGDWPLIQSALLELVPTLQRPRLLGRYGHPSTLVQLAEWMHGTDMPLAAASAEAFARITGTDVRGQRVTPPLADDADDFEREMAPPLWLPDLAQVDAHLDQYGDELATCDRWNRGLPLGTEVEPGVLDRVDLPARWDACVRASLAGRPIASPPPAI
jgi:hypothetical protein